MSTVNIIPRDVNVVDDAMKKKSDHIREQTKRSMKSYKRN